MTLARDASPDENEVQRRFVVPSWRSVGSRLRAGVRTMNVNTKTLTGIQTFVGLTAVAGGAALAAAPDGHLLAADPAALTNT